MKRLIIFGYSVVPILPERYKKEGKLKIYGINFCVSYSKLMSSDVYFTFSFGLYYWYLGFSFRAIGDRRERIKDKLDKQGKYNY